MSHKQSSTSRTMISRHSPQIEWQILDEHTDERYASAFAEVEPKRPIGERRRHRLYAYAGLATLFLLLIGGWLWHLGQAQIGRLETELQNVTEAEVWVAAHGDRQSATGLASNPSMPAWPDQFSRDAVAVAALQAVASGSELATDARIVDLGNDWAVVQMQTSDAGDAGAYRQTRFFRQTIEGWRRTAPDADWWGAPDELESAYFSFSFRARDAKVVAEIAPRADAMYGKLRSDFGLGLPAEDQKPVIEISPTELPYAAFLRTPSADHFVIPSPALYLAPVTVNDAELVLQSLALQLSAAVIQEAVAQYRILWVHDEEILSALRLWALWDLDLPLADWREEVVEWRLGAMQTDNPHGVTALPSHYEALCALHGVWLPSPSLISIPLTCTELDRAPSPSSLQATLSATRLEQLTASIFWQDSSPPGGILRTSPSWAPVMLATLFKYIVSSYGREQLPVFLDGLGRYRDWPAFSLALFDIPSSQFAAGWYKYLVAQYGAANLSGEHR